MLEKIKETAEYIRSQMTTQPYIGIILGTGLGNLATQITDRLEIPYKSIPNFPISTVEGHSGKLIIGKLGGVDVMAMQGRCYFSCACNACCGHRYLVCFQCLGRCQSGF